MPPGSGSGGGWEWPRLSDKTRQSRCSVEMSHPAGRRAAAGSEDSVHRRDGRVGRRMAPARMEMYTVIGCRAGVNGGRRRWVCRTTGTEAGPGGPAQTWPSAPPPASATLVAMAGKQGAPAPSRSRLRRRGRDSRRYGGQARGARSLAVAAQKTRSATLVAMAGKQGRPLPCGRGSETRSFNRNGLSNHATMAGAHRAPFSAAC